MAPLSRKNMLMLSMSSPSDLSTCGTTDASDHHHANKLHHHQPSAMLYASMGGVLSSSVVAVDTTGLDRAKSSTSSSNANCPLPLPPQRSLGAAQTLTTDLGTISSNGTMNHDGSIPMTASNDIPEEEMAHHRSSSPPLDRPSLLASWSERGVGGAVAIKPTENVVVKPLAGVSSADKKKQQQQQRATLQGLDQVSPLVVMTPSPTTTNKKKKLSIETLRRYHSSDEIIELKKKPPVVKKHSSVGSANGKRRSIFGDYWQSPRAAAESVVFHPVASMPPPPFPSLADAAAGPRSDGVADEEYSSHSGNIYTDEKYVRQRMEEKSKAKTKTTMSMSSAGQQPKIEGETSYHSRKEVAPPPQSVVSSSSSSSSRSKENMGGDVAADWVNKFFRFSSSSDLQSDDSRSSTSEAKRGSRGLPSKSSKTAVSELSSSPPAGESSVSTASTSSVHTFDTEELSGRQQQHQGLGAPPTPPERPSSAPPLEDLDIMTTTSSPRLSLSSSLRGRGDLLLSKSESVSFSEDVMGGAEEEAAPALVESPRSILLRPKICKADSIRVAREKRLGSKNKSDYGKKPQEEFSFSAADSDLWQGRSPPRDSSLTKDAKPKQGGGGRRHTMATTTSTTNRRFMCNNRSITRGGHPLADGKQSQSIFHRPDCIRVSVDVAASGTSPPLVTPRRQCLGRGHRRVSSSGGGSSSTSLSSLNSSWKNHVQFDPRVRIVEYLSDDDEGKADNMDDSSYSYHQSSDNKGPVAGGQVTSSSVKSEQQQRWDGRKKMDWSNKLSTHEEEAADAQKMLLGNATAGKWFTVDELTRFKVDAFHDSQLLLMKAPRNSSPSDKSARNQQHSKSSSRLRRNTGGNSSIGVTRDNLKKRALFTNPLLKCTPHDNIVLEGSSELDLLLTTHIRNVLVVDPNPTMRSLFKKSLHHIYPHADVSTCPSAECALNMIDAAQVACHPEGDRRQSASSEDSSSFRVEGASRRPYFDIVIVEERLELPPARSHKRGDSCGDSSTTTRLLGSSPKPRASFEDFDRAGLTHHQHQPPGDEPQQPHHESCRQPMSGSQFLSMFSPDNRSSSSSSSAKESARRMPFLIGVSAVLCEDGVKLTKAGADMIWGKPPPKIDISLRNELLTAVLTKRGLPTYVCRG